MDIKKQNLITFNIILPILLGGIIYVIFRTKSLTMFSWFENLGLSSLVTILRDKFTSFKGFVPSWFYYSLPDGLWMYSFSSSFIIFINGKKSIFLWLLIPLFTGPVVEILQLLELFPGTFDIIDIFFYILAIFISLTFNKKQLWTIRILSAEY